MSKNAEVMLIQTNTREVIEHAQFNFFMCSVTKKHVRIDCSAIKAEIVLSDMLCQQSMKVAIANQRSHAFTTTTDNKRIE